MSRSTLAAPVARTRKRRSRRWNEHWPLPVAFVLAIAFWFYLDSRISTERLYRCKIVTDRHPVDAPLGDHDGALRLRVPEGYTISAVRATGALEQGKTPEEQRSVVLRFAGPKSKIQLLETRLDFFVDLEAPNEQERRGSTRTTRRIDVDDVNLADAALLRQLVEMRPMELSVVLEASSTEKYTLGPGSVVVTYPDPQEDWSRRVFLDTLRFEPPLVSLRGPEERLRQLGGSSRIFELDVRKLASMEDRLLPSDDGFERARLSFPLRLREPFATDLTLLDPGVTASVEIAPPAWSSPEFEVRVLPIWSTSPLGPDEFALDRHTVKFRVRSYDTRLTRVLKEKGETWARRWLLAVADVGRVPNGPETNTEKFTTQLRPQFFYLGDEGFLIGKHLEIDPTSPLFLSRK